MSGGSNNVIRSALAPLGLSTAEIRALLDDPQRALADGGGAARVRAALVPAYRRGFRVVFIVGAALAGLAVLLAWALLPQVDLHRPDDDAFREKKEKMGSEGSAELDEEAAVAATAAAAAVRKQGMTAEEEKRSAAKAEAGNA
jgi:hypothetical protein